MPAELTPHGRSSCRTNMTKSARGPRNSTPGPATRQSKEHMHVLTKTPAPEESLSRHATRHNIRGNTTTAIPCTGVQKRSRTVSSSRRTTAPKETKVHTARDGKDAVNEVSSRERPRSPEPRKHRKSRTEQKLNDKCIALIEDVSKKILAVNDQLTERDAKMLIDLLEERLTKGANCSKKTEPYREESSYRLIKSEHQHQKVMMNCGMKKKEQSKTNWTKTLYDDNTDMKNTHGDTDFVKYSATMDGWDPVAEANKVLKKYKKFENVPKLGYSGDKNDAEDDPSMEDLTQWNKLPDAVDKLMTYFDGFTENSTDKPQKAVKRYSDVNDRREKIKLWDMQRRLTLGLKLETRALHSNPSGAGGIFGGFDSMESA